MQGVTEVCIECEFDPHAVGDDQLGPELARLAVGYETVIADVAAGGRPALSSRPSAEVWSILEYVGHVEFIYDAVGQMCDVVDENELGSINGVDPDEHCGLSQLWCLGRELVRVANRSVAGDVAESRFNDVDATEMSDRIRAAGDRARAALDGLDSGALGWMLAFNGNPAPLRLLTIAMVHECHHHLRDVTTLATA